MKAKRSKARKKTPVRKKSKVRVRKKARPVQRRLRPPQSPAIVTTPPAPSIPGFKTCEEPEVGDIGGFGDVVAFESHEKLCGEKATEFCAACGKNLCSSHYELLHRDHDTGGQHLTEHSMTQ